MRRLLQRRFRWQWRLVRINYDFNQCRPARSDGFSERRAYAFGPLDRPAKAAARFGVLREVRVIEFAAVFRIAQEDDLLPTNLSERVVLDDDDDDRQIVFARRQELAHQHREAAVADERDRL